MFVIKIMVEGLETRPYYSVFFLRSLRGRKQTRERKFKLAASLRLSSGDDVLMRLSASQASNEIYCKPNEIYRFISSLFFVLPPRGSLWMSTIFKISRQCFIHGCCKHWYICVPSKSSLTFSHIARDQLYCMNIHALICIIISRKIFSLQENAKRIERGLTSPFVIIIINIAAARQATDTFSHHSLSSSVYMASVRFINTRSCNVIPRAQVLYTCIATVKVGHVCTSRTCFSDFSFPLIFWNVWVVECLYIITLLFHRTSLLRNTFVDNCSSNVYVGIYETIGRVVQVELLIFVNINTELVQLDAGELFAPVSVSTLNYCWKVPILMIIFKRAATCLRLCLCVVCVYESLGWLWTGILIALSTSIKICLVERKMTWLMLLIMLEHVRAHARDSEKEEK